MVKPRLLDLFSCAGGAGLGYARAGFDVVGVDIVRQPRYPFEHHVADALEFLEVHGHEFDVIHASPPCQAYSITKHTHDVTHPDLVEPTREALVALGRPYIIENVVGAPLIDPVLLCGTEFGLRTEDVDGTVVALRRHRLFESSEWLMGAGGCAHDATPVAGVYGGGRHKRPEDRDNRARRGGYTPDAAVRARLIGVEGLGFTQHELSQSIPPAYTEFLGAQLIRVLA